MRLHQTLLRVCALAALLSAAPARAQQMALSEEGAAAKGHPRGSYTGVKPGGDEAPAVRAKAGTTPPAITWPGFQMQPDGSSRVFVQTTSRVDVSAALVNGKVIVDFGNVTVPGSNNRFPLITKFFNTPVTLVEVKRANKRTTLVLTMRASVEPRVSHDQAKSGFHFVYIDFPPGNYLPSELQPAAAPGPLPPPDPPPAAGPDQAATRDAPAHLDGSASGRASASGSASASLDGELPPGMGKTKAKARGKAKASGSLRIGK